MLDILLKIIALSSSILLILTIIPNICAGLKHSSSGMSSLLSGLATVAIFILFTYIPVKDSFYVTLILFLMFLGSSTGERLYDKKKFVNATENLKSFIETIKSRKD